MENGKKGLDYLLPGGSMTNNLKHERPPGNNYRCPTPPSQCVGCVATGPTNNICSSNSSTFVQVVHEAPHSQFFGGETAKLTPQRRQLLISMTPMDLIDIMNEDTECSPGHGNSQSKSDICGKESDQQTQAEHPEKVHLPGPTTSPSISLKLPIPRLHKPALPLQRRVPRACAPCRASKSKCTGERPRCQRCTVLQQNCRYPARKWDETQR
jgi:hypothetical protein